MRKTIISVGLLTALAGAASGQVLVYEGHLSPGSVGVHSGIPTSSGGLVSLGLFDYTPGDEFDHDSYIGAFDSGDGLIEADDDDGPGFLSHIDYLAYDGPNTLRVTGFGDPGFVGAHGEDFDYRAVVTLGPTMADGGSNDTHGSAQAVIGANAAAIRGLLTPGDVDFYSFTAAAGAMLTFSVADLTPGDEFDHDSYIGLFDGAGSLIEADDDDGPGFLSAIHYTAPADGVYVIAVTGYGDDSFGGSHGEDFEYYLTMTGAVPAPASLALLGLGGMVATRRRR